jgi:hypothetical protein
MRSYALALGSVLLSSPLLGSCTVDRDYQVAVTWTINGMVPDAALCQEQGIARARFEARTASGKPLKPLEARCDGVITLSDQNEYGGFYTTRSFVWDRDYEYTLTLLRADGSAASTPGTGTFYVPFDNADVWELGFLDFLNPTGTVGALSGEWSVRNATDLAAACAADRISKVRILAASALDTDLVDTFVVAEAACSAGRFASPGKVLATGDYLFQYVAVSDGGNLVEAGKPIAATVTGNDVVLPREMFLSN